MTEMRERLRRLPKAPVEGWISLVAILVLTLTLAWSIDDAAWVLGRDHFTDFLALTVGWGVAIGFIGAKVGWGRWPTYLLGSLLAALIVPLYVGDVLQPEASWFAQYEATATSVVEAWRDLALRNQSVTQQYGHFLLTLGLFTWATAMYASYTTFGHRRPLNAIVLVGIVLVANMGFTYADQLTLLVLFSLAALFLLIRFHAFDEESEWLRRRIGDPTAVSELYLRGGSVFIAVAVVGSLFLTNTASSSPLAGAVRGVGDQLIVLGRDFQRFLPQGGANRPLGVQFGTTAPISGVWTTAQSEAFSIQFGKPEDEKLYWRAAVYDTFDLTAWSQNVVAGYDVAAGEEVLAKSADKVTESGRREVTFRVFPADFRQSSILSPQSPWKIDAPVRVAYVGDGQFVASIDRSGGDPYTVSALVRERGDEDRRGAHDQPSSCGRDRLPAGDPRAVPRGVPTERSRRAATRSSSSRRSWPRWTTRPTRTTSRARWSTTCSRPRTSSTTPTSATSPARACRRSSASPGSARATASTTRRRWRSCSASTASRRAWLPGSCRANAMTRDSPSRCRSARHMPGSRSTSLNTAGWSSTRRAVASPQAEPLPTGEPVPTAAPGSSASLGLGAALPPFLDEIPGPGLRRRHLPSTASRTSG